MSDREFRFSVSIKKGNKTIVEIDEYSISEGTITFLFGESGIGKSIINKAIYGLLDPADLDITINEVSYNEYLKTDFLAQLRQNSFFVFQEPSTHLNPLMRIDEQLHEGSIADKKYETGILKQLWDGADISDIEPILNIFPKPYRPSGGEKQRFLLAMAFKKISLMLSEGSPNENSYYVFDEPTGSLDNHFRNIFIKLLLESFKQQAFTIVLITHDYSMISHIYEHYASLRKSIEFKELTLSNDELHLRYFEPDLYQEWVKTQHKKRKELIQKGNKKVFSIESGVRIFGRELVISNDPAGKRKTALDIYEGNLYYLKARSGVGKTTLVKIMMGLLKAEKVVMHFKTMKVDEKTPLHFWKKYVYGRFMTMVFQHADEALNLNSSVQETFFGLPTQPKITSKNVTPILEELFDQDVDEHFLMKKVDELSGGQKQRLNLLRSLSLDTDIVILDEPTNGLDFETSKKVIDMVRKKQQEGKGILIISHYEEFFNAIIPEENIYYLHAKEK